jgi:archaellum component FlaG (FlaF/FlaG flagellin family)
MPTILLAVVVVLLFAAAAAGTLTERDSAATRATLARHEDV